MGIKTEIRWKAWAGIEYWPPGGVAPIIGWPRVPSPTDEKQTISTETMFDWSL